MSTRSRSKLVAFLLLVLICVSLEVANACSPAPVVMRVTCDDNSDFLPFTNLRSGETWSVDPAKLASLGKAICGVEIPATEPRIAAIVAEYGDHYAYFKTGNLEFTPYRPDVLTRLETENLSLLTCRTNFIEVVQNWIVHYEHRPEYCGNEALTLSFCGAADRIMLLPFLSYLYSNPTAINQLYLGGILLLAFLAGWLVWRQRPFFEPTIGKSFLFLLVCPSLLYVTFDNGFSLDIGTLGWVVMVWMIVSGIAAFFRFLGRFPRDRETPVEE